MNKHNNTNNNTGLTAVDFDPFAEGALDLTIPATESQREVWAAVQMGDDASCAYNESISLRIQGALDVGALQAAVQAIVDRHEALRITFSSDGATQCIGNSRTINVPLVDLGHLSAEESASQLKTILRADVEEAFDLEHGPLFRAQIVRLANDHYQLIMCAHHIICDGLSWGSLLPDLAALYTDSGADLGTAPRFSDYARFLIEDEQRKMTAVAEQFWLNTYADEVPLLDLPTDRPRPGVKTYVGEREDYILDAALVADLKKIGARNGCTFVVTLLAAFEACLYRLTGQNDMVVGMMSAGNSANGFDNLVGHCVNLLPVRCVIAGDKPFVDLLKNLRSQVFAATDHQQVSFGSLVKKLSLPRDPGRIPLVPVTFNIDQAMGNLTFGKLDVDVFSNPRRYENFEISLNALETVNNQVVLECTYNRDLFDAATIRRRMAEFETLISGIIQNPQQNINALPLLPPDEQQLLEQWNTTDMPVPPEGLIHRLIEQQATATPEKIAAICGEEQLGYGELETRANQLAQHLRTCNVTANVLVGLCLERSVDMLVAMLAVLKAGGAYVPLDPDYPHERLNWMLKDSRASVLLTQDSLKDALPVAGVTVISLDGDAALIAQASGTRPDNVSGPDDLAYVIYTSGSTGNPKGVMVPHGAVVNFLAGMAQRPGLNNNDVVLAVTTLSFDIAVLELWLPLSVGAKVVIASREAVSDGNQLMDLIDQSNPSVMQATPATWRLLLEAGWQGTPRLKVLCGGEALPADLAHSLLERVDSVWNMYGPTETTVWSGCAQLDIAAPVTVGHAIANTRFYVLDKTLQHVPVGVPGELYIGGAGVTQGYLNRPELTAERFINSPFRADERLYRTGDLVRYLADGQLEYFQRLDDQIKMRGFRIEPGEIEVALTSASEVAEAVVVAREITPGDIRLLACLVSATEEAPDAVILRQHLRSMLPEYMVPQHFITLTALPRTPNGKIDRKALPDIDDTGSQQTHVSPTSETELYLVTMWQEVLKLEEVGVQNNFFDLGGHSILATRILARIKQDYQLVLPLRHFFAAPTVAEMAREIDALVMLESNMNAPTGDVVREELEF